MKRTLITALLAALLLPSCVESQIGKCIRAAGTDHTGLDIGHPVDGKVYQTPAQRRATPAQAYLHAPEVIYRRYYEPFEFCAPKNDSCAQPYAVRPTGRSQVLLIDGSSPTAPRTSVTQAGQIPTNARAYPAENLIRVGEPHGPLLPTPGAAPRPATWRSVAAAPFDYLLDPLLSITGTLVFWTGAIVSSPFVWVCECSQQGNPGTSPSPQP